jgi:phosphohistidine phosphatase SixA
MARYWRWAWGLLLLLAAGGPGLAQDSWKLLQSGTVVLFRHALAPGVSDPANFQLNDCATQRNLDETGRQQARLLGQQFRQRSIPVGRVLTSQWCRTRETAALAFPGLPQDEPAFNSFFGDRSTETSQTRKALQILSQWRGPGVLVVVTHQVNITALTGIVPNSGEGVIVRYKEGRLEVLGKLDVP